VIEEANTSGEFGDARAIDIDNHTDAGFEGIAGNVSLPHGGLEARKCKARMIPSVEIGALISRAIPQSKSRFDRKPSMSRYWSTVVSKLTPYVPGEQPQLANLIKLNTNENPYGPSPRVIEAIRNELDESLRLYPDPSGEKLKTAIAALHGIETRQIFLGNGSDEVLAHVFLGLLKHEGRPVLFPDVTYSFYPVYCGLYQVEYETVALADDFSIRVDDYERANSVKPGGIIFPNPNAPTGRALLLGDIERLLKDHPDSVVVIDEAYIDFGGMSAIPLIDRYPNLLVVQTLSKSRSLAGLRVGFAAGQFDLIDALERVKNSFNSYPLDRLALAGGVAAFEDTAYFEKTCGAVVESRDILSAQLESLGFEVLPSAANFVFARHARYDAQELALSLRQSGILVRHFKRPRIDQFLRITVGTDEQCAALMAALRAITA